MHIPDGFLDATTVAITYAVMVVFMALALRKMGNTSREALSLSTVLAAGIFAAQMLNWPIPGGTSLHFVGGALAGILLGPYLGFFTMFLVLLVQCLVFHDGGITALGANVLNMAIIDVLVGYGMYMLVVKSLGNSRKTRMLGAFLGGWLGITLAGIACGLEIGFSTSFPLGITITVPVMGIWHAILGVIEGLITALTVDYLYPRLPHIQLAMTRGVGR